MIASEVIRGVHRHLTPRKIMPSGAFGWAREMPVISTISPAGFPPPSLLSIGIDEPFRRSKVSAPPESSIRPRA